MGNSQKMAKARRGSVMMETVIVMPILLFLIFMIVQFAHIWTAKQMVSYAAFCATRAITVVKSDQQQASQEQITAAENAAKMVLSWMCIADNDEDDDESVLVPGWGKILGSGSAYRAWGKQGRVKVDILESGSSNGKPIAAVKVQFRFPLMISAMAVNAVLATAASESPASMDSGEYDLYSNLNRMAGDPPPIDGWPYVELTETCVLPMPYSTQEFPSGAFEKCSLH